MKMLAHSAKPLFGILLIAAVCGCAGDAPLSERMYEGLRLRNQLHNPLQDQHSGGTPLHYRQYEVERRKLSPAP